MKFRFIPYKYKLQPVQEPINPVVSTIKGRGFQKLVLFLNKVVYKIARRTYERRYQSIPHGKGNVSAI